MRTCLAFLLLLATLSAGTVNTTLTVNNAAVSIGTSDIVISGNATLTGIGSGTFASTIALMSLGATNTTAQFTIALTTGDTLTGTITFPSTLLSGAGGSATGSGTVTGGTGAEAGATGSFPSLTIAESTNAGITISITGAGTVTTSGSSSGGGTGGGGTTTPAITLVGDAAAYSSNIAPGEIIIVKGQNLSPSGFTEFSFPLPTTSPDGAFITFTPTAGGSGTNLYLLYEYNQSGTNQLAAVVPSSVATGSYNVTVTAGGNTSAPASITVVKSQPEIFTQDSSGSGLAVVQNYVSSSELDINRFTTNVINGVHVSAAYPGQTLIGWATGFGAGPGSDNVASSGYNFDTNGHTVVAIVGGMQLPTSYGGRAPGLTGVDQFNFTLPSNIQTGCAVPLQVSVDGVVSEQTFIAIATSASANACEQPGFSSSQLDNLSSGGAYTAGNWSIDQFTETQPAVGTVTLAVANGSFTQYSGFHVDVIPPSFASLPTNGACFVTRGTANGSTGQVTSLSATTLDAGAATLNGPSGSNISNAMFRETNNYYSLNIGETGLPAGTGFGNGKLVAGTYTISAAGGKDVNAFQASTTIGTPLTLTSSLPSTVTESQGLTISWQPGSTPTDLVLIVGSSAISSQNAVQFECITTAGQNTFTVGPSILEQLPPTTSGTLVVLSTPAPTSGSGQFTATLKSGGSFNAFFTIAVGYAAQVTYK